MDYEFYDGHFERADKERRIFWRRMGQRPDFAGKKVLDVGCGLGGNVIDAAKAGASECVGLEVAEEYVAFATEKVKNDYPELKDIVRFECSRIEEFREDGFDIVLSKDCFEHVDNLPVVLSHVQRCLKGDGELYLGFGPLWHSPFGDHDLSKHLLPFWKRRIPWAHVLLPEAVFVKLVSKRRHEPIQSIESYGLNKQPYSYYKELLFDSDLRIRKFELNSTDSKLAGLFDAMSALVGVIPGMRKFFVRTIYVIAEKGTS